MRKKNENSRLQNDKSHQHGQSLVELALSITFLLILLAGVADFGRAFFTWIELREAAEEGAIFGALFPADANGIESRTRNSSTQPVDLTDTGNVTVTINLSGTSCSGTYAVAGNSLQVIVAYNFPLTMPFLGTIIGTQTIPIVGDYTTTIMRPEC